MFEFRTGQPEEHIITALWDKICSLTNNTQLMGDVQAWFREDVGNDGAVVLYKNGELAGVCSGVMHKHHFTSVIVFVFPEYLPDLDVKLFYEKITEIWTNLPGVERIMAEFESWRKIFGPSCPEYDLSEFGFNRHTRLLMQADLTGYQTEKKARRYSSDKTDLLFEIKPLTKEHFPRVRKILSGIVEPGLEDVWDEAFIDYNIEKCLTDVAETENSVCKGAFVKGELQGFLFVDPQGFVRYTAVSKKIAGKGIGTALMKTGLDKLAALGVSNSKLIVTEVNKPAVRLYEKTGFKEIGRYSVWTWHKKS
ncbi:MAG: GNAT family N-acetyltransferase [Firmicutes bacterium]|nr:GNAT family N-acetyltransferase [Bacillota bacterium]